MHSMNNQNVPPHTTKFLELLGRPLIQMILIATLAILAYANSFQVPFVFDDESSITENPVILELGNFFTWGGYDYLPNRFIGYLSFALNYHFGGFNVAGYHLVNLAIHIANGLLIYALLRLTLRTPFFQSNPTSSHQDEELHPDNRSLLTSQRYLPFLAALLFVCHPIQTQAVTYIVQRLTSLATLFFLASLVLHIRWRLSQRGGASFWSWPVLSLWGLSLLSALLAMKTKEIAFTLPMVVLLYEYCFFGRPNLRRLLFLLPILSTIVIIPIAMLNLNKPAGQILSDVSQATVVQASLSRWEYLITQFSVIVTYLRLLLLPINQNLDYDYPANHSMLEPRAFLSLALLSALFGFAIYLYYRSRPKLKHSGCDLEDTESCTLLLTPHPLRLIAFGILWFFLTLSVESSLIPIADIIFEHRVYLPSVGFFLAVAGFAWSALRRWPRANSFAFPGLVLVALILCGATYARNSVWKNEETLWKDVVAKSPAKARPHANLGTIYGKQERVDDAIREYEATVAIVPEQPETLSNMVILYLSAGRQAEAAAACASLLKLDPGMEKPLKLYQILKMSDVRNEALIQVREACGTSSP